jgi:hypothetical protein
VLPGAGLVSSLLFSELTAIEEAEQREAALRKAQRLKAKQEEEEEARRRERRFKSADPHKLQAEIEVRLALEYRGT